MTITKQNWLRIPSNLDLNKFEKDEKEYFYLIFHIIISLREFSKWLRTAESNHENFKHGWKYISTEMLSQFIDLNPYLEKMIQLGLIEDWSNIEDKEINGFKRYRMSSELRKSNDKHKLFKWIKTENELIDNYLHRIEFHSEKTLYHSLL